MSRTNKRILKQLEEQINGLIKTAEDLAEDNNLSFTIDFSNGTSVSRDWEGSTTSWSSSSDDC